MPVTVYRRRRLRGLSALTIFVTLPPGHVAVPNRPGYGPITVVSTQVRGFDGNVYQLTNHLTWAASYGGGREWLLASAGEADADDSAPDFIAVIDVTRGSPTYGRVVNNATFTSQLRVALNRPVWRHGLYGDARPHGLLSVVSNRYVR